MGKNGIIIIDNLKKEQQFIVGNNEKKIFIILFLEGKSESGNVNIIIRGRKAKVQILGIILGFGSQIIELNTLQDHLKEASISDLLIKSILFDQAKLYYKGLIKIEKDAQKSNAYQKNQTILMSDKSWADTRPYLEILADDVKCTHGATLGKIDAEQLYYLETRGISRESATKLLINGFLQDVLMRIPDELMRKQLEGRVSYIIDKLLEGQGHPALDAGSIP